MSHKQLIGIGLLVAIIAALLTSMIVFMGVEITLTILGLCATAVAIAIAIAITFAIKLIVEG